MGACSRRRGPGWDFIPTAIAPVAAGDPSPQEVLAKYHARQRNTPRLGDFQVEVEIDASLPGMQKRGGMAGTRVQKGQQTLSYAGARFTGDDMIKRDVITRYLNGEKEALRHPPNVALIPENYQFEYRGVALHGDRRAHVYEVIPKAKRVGMYRGELWIDMETALPLREFGRLVHNPSVFLKNVDFVRDYRLTDGRALPARFISTMDTRLVGPAEISITFQNYQLEAAP